MPVQLVGTAGADLTIWHLAQVIEPIQSRCAIVRFSRLSDAEILERLLHVVRAEGVSSPPAVRSGSCANSTLVCTSRSAAREA